MGACIDPEKLGMEIREGLARHYVIHLAVSPEWFSLANKEIDPYSSRTVLENYSAFEVKVVDDVVHPRGAEVRVGPAWSWSDPTSDPAADIRAVMSVDPARSYGKGSFAYSNAVAYWQTVPEPPPEPERDWVYPPTCVCDMQLCMCNTPDPGQTADEIMRELAAEMVAASGASLKEVQRVMEGFAAAVQKTAEDVKAGLQAIGEWWAKIASSLPEPPKPPRHGPPPKLTFPPIPALASIHTPPPHRAPHRGPR